jgi:hypothetical protein
MGQDIDKLEELTQMSAKMQQAAQSQMATQESISLIQQTQDETV